MGNILVHLSIIVEGENVSELASIGLFMGANMSIAIGLKNCS